MFRFKDSNFYLNQVCVPHCVCEVDLYDGMLVDVDMGETTYADKKLAEGKYVVIGESLNRTAVVSNPDGYAIVHDVHPAGSYVRVFEVAKLKGVEFVTDNFEGLVVGGGCYVNDRGVLVKGNGQFRCVEVRGGIAHLVCEEAGIDE